jgi:hypothetical protein
MAGKAQKKKVCLNIEISGWNNTSREFAEVENKELHWEYKNNITANNSG